VLGLAAALAVAVVVVTAGAMRQRARAAPAERHAAARAAVERLAAGDAAAARCMADAVIGTGAGPPDAAFVRACLRAAASDREGAFADLEACAGDDTADAAVCLDAALVAAALAREDASWTERARAWFAEAARRAELRDDARSVLAGAAACVALGRLDDAERRLASAGPLEGALADDADALRAAILAARGDPDSARDVLTRATAARPSPSLAAMLARLDAADGDTLALGLDAVRRGETSVARDLLREAALASEDDLTAVALLASTLGGPATSEETVREMRRLEGRGAAGLVLLGHVLLAHGDAAGALPVLRRALDRAPGDPAALRGAVSAALARGDAVAAAAVCRDRLARGDPAGLADFLLGVVLEHQGEDAAAETSYGNALAKDAACWPASDRLAESLLRRGDAAGAARVCDAGLATDPECLPLRLRRADVRIAAGDAAGAVAALTRLAADHPGRAAVELHLARALLAAGRGDEAALHFDRCLAADPDCVEARVGSIALAAAAGRLAPLVASLRAAADASPRDPTLRFALGVAAEHEGRTDAAEREYRAALAAAPRFAIAANNLAWLVASQPGRAAEARPFAETAGRLLPRNPHVLDTRGWVRLLCADAAGAEADLARAARLLPERVDVAGRLARARAALAAAPDAYPVPEPRTEVPR
jgi:tetratricopeptide (TPR) repeat protein